MQIRVIISGRNYDLADALPEEIALPEGATLNDALQAIGELLPAERPLPSSCLVAVSGTHLGTIERHQSRVLKPGDELVLIAPVAGG